MKSYQNRLWRSNLRRKLFHRSANLSPFVGDGCRYNFTDSFYIFAHTCSYFFVNKQGIFSYKRYIYLLWFLRLSVSRLFFNHSPLYGQVLMVVDGHKITNRSSWKWVSISRSWKIIISKTRREILRAFTAVTKSVFREIFCKSGNKMVKKFRQIYTSFQRTRRKRL